MVSASHVIIAKEIILLNLFSFGREKIYHYEIDHLEICNLSGQEQLPISSNGDKVRLMSSNDLNQYVFNFSSSQLVIIINFWLIRYQSDYTRDLCINWLRTTIDGHVWWKCLIDISKYKTKLKLSLMRGFFYILF